METLGHEVRQLLQQFLQAMPEDAARVRGPWSRERQETYERALNYVIGRVRKPEDWREQITIREAVIQEVRRLLDPNSETEIP